MNIQTFTLGDWMTNCFILHTTNHAWLIDAGFNPQPILDYLQTHNLTLDKIILTHAHLDHIAGLAQIRQHHPDAPILIHEAEQHFLSDAALNLSIILPQPIIAPEPDQLLHHDDTLHLDDLPFHIRHTPGHSPGGITLHQPHHNLALVGDTLFAGSIGRHDFPTSDGQTLLHSIHSQILTLPDQTRLLPGHGPETTIAHERSHNPFLQ